MEHGGDDEPTFGYQRSPLTVLIDPSRRSQSRRGKPADAVTPADPATPRRRPGKVAVILAGVLALALLVPGGYAIGRFSANYSHSIGASTFVEPPQSMKRDAVRPSSATSARALGAPTSAPAAIFTTANATSSPTKRNTSMSVLTTLKVTAAENDLVIYNGKHCGPNA